MRHKCLFCILFFSLICPALIFGQDRGITWGALSNASLTGGEFKVINLEANVGFRFAKNFFLISKFETAAALFRIDRTDENHINITAGVFIRYNLYKFNGGLLDIRIGTGASILKKDWSYSYYDGGLFVHATDYLYKPTIGFGVRYYDSRNTLHRDYSRVYMSLGFTFN